ncbi:MAG: efflux RND transporter periplasmic adaptor subunit [Sphaerochaeta sp.]|jgi:multidrug efflux pump subunit AcrA (membrane-fusion protein)|nr:efflux RND transporter periplasmic adaptor subunit [Sphaerochaeta sp.]PKL29177.1 MAG: efflux transporter periplasmic adaptor subunit [Spirochaetae bacterium HGW-Spirochaetae-2]
MSPNTNSNANPNNSTEDRVRSNLKKKLRKKRIKRLITWVVVVAMLGIAVFTYQFYKTNGRMPFTSADKLAAQQATAATQETTVREIEFSQTIDISGNVEAFQTQKVVFRSTGAVTGVFVEEGVRVKKGDLLATIDDTSQSYTLANIESQIEEAKLQGSVRQLELLEMQKTMAVNNLDYTKAYANFDGVVASVSVDEGDYFEAGDAAMVIIDRSKLKATVEIDEIDIQSVQTGMTAELTFDSIPGKTIDATVTYIPMLGRTTSQGIGVLDVEIVIEDPPTALAPGFTFAGTISADEVKRMLVLPTSAIVSNRRGSDTVRKKGADGNPVSVEVTTKYLGEGMSEILSGNLKAGDVVLMGTTTNSMFNIGIPGATPMQGSGGGAGLRTSL